MDKVDTFLDKVDNFMEFLTVNELKQELEKLQSNDWIKINEIGRSQNGYSILSAKIGNGINNALIFGFPHPNEPVGSLTCLSLINVLTENEFLRNRFTWHIIPCADPDGAKLNEGWFKGEFTIEKYAKNFYRSMTPLQTDWTFPLKYKNHIFNDSPANVIALAKLIEKTKPQLVYPIHNAGMSGAYFFMTRYFGDKFYKELLELCEKLSIPLDMGEPELEIMQEWKKPVYREFTGKEYHDYYTSVGIEADKNIGDSSIGYSKNFNQDIIGIIGEIPYFYDKRIEDNDLTKKTRRENIINEIASLEKLKIFVNNIISTADLNKNSIFYSLFQYIVSQWEKVLHTRKNYFEKEEYAKMATVSQEFSTNVIPIFRQSLMLGELRRLLIESPKTNKNIKLIKDVDNAITEKIEFVKKNSEIKIFPIRKLVQLQLGFLLLSLKYF
ncbi:MAG TPA: M14 family zinc carboxypeptidase [Nitrososphaeraceae archaeon]|nr:M14 family zinc carboxypeptidase [Nitrososphaeraceae archaeon]